ncbi:MAG: sigma-70 family RNA polymerase sigma factor [Minicystis sp.]
MASDEEQKPDPALEILQRAVDGDARAMRQLVRDLTPVIRAAVGWVLSRGQAPGRREARQEIEDVTQTVLLALFVDRGRVLLQWDPTRGLDLPSFVSLLARRETVSVLRSRRRSPWTEDPTQLEDLDRNAVPRMGPESEAISRDMLAALSDAVRERLSPRGAEIFELMFLQGRPAEEVVEITGLSAEAVYVWKSRLVRQLRDIFDDLGRPPPTIPPPPDPGERPKTGPIPVVPRARPSSPEGRGTPPTTGTIPRVQRASGTGPIPAVPRRTAAPDTGPIPAVPRRTPASDTGPIPAVPRRTAAPDTGPIPAVPRRLAAPDTGPIPAVPRRSAAPDTGPIPAVPRRSAAPDTGPIPAVPRASATGTVPVVPRARPSSPENAAPLRAAAAGSSSVPPPRGDG